MPWDAAILAGGQARRLDGQDKSALPIAGVPVLDRQLAALRRLTSRIVIVGGPPDRYDRVGIPVVPDLLPDIGPLGGLYTALRGASERIIVLARMAARGRCAKLPMTATTGHSQLAPNSFRRASSATLDQMAATLETPTTRIN